ncbi:hypothetical protein l11_11170 [Neisseria weaveri LMG 5135]|nr:hypothetical protein l11_11170 [Neisseria weaveri LMG 5135]
MANVISLGVWCLIHNTVSSVYLASGEAAMLISSIYKLSDGLDYTERPSET